MSGKRALSAMQKQAISLYRHCIRGARTKQQQEGLDPQTGNVLRQHARARFDEHRSVSTRNIQLVEHLIRQGQRQLQMLLEPGVSLRL
mmetsp:Transcript_13445/g.23627  ORF Transcript_13445/g.23627 Transcript_13445/m.23627 type:complete len:88 (+) Transcript_13445:199-462(+)